MTSSPPRGESSLSTGPFRTCRALLDGVGPDAAVFVLDPTKDGVQQIVDILAANDLD